MTPAPKKQPTLSPLSPWRQQTSPSPRRNLKRKCRSNSPPSSPSRGSLQPHLDFKSPAPTNSLSTRRPSKIPRRVTDSPLPGSADAPLFVDTGSERTSRCSSTAPSTHHSTVPQSGTPNFTPRSNDRQVLGLDLTVEIGAGARMFFEDGKAVLYMCRAEFDGETLKILQAQPRIRF